MAAQVLYKKFMVGKYHQVIESGILAITFQAFINIQFPVDQLLVLHQKSINCCEKGFDLQESRDGAS